MIFRFRFIPWVNINRSLCIHDVACIQSSKFACVLGSHTKIILLCASGWIRMSLPVNKHIWVVSQAQILKSETGVKAIKESLSAGCLAGSYHQGPLCRLCAAGRAQCRRSLRCWSGTPPAALPAVSMAVWGSTPETRSMTPYSPFQTERKLHTIAAKSK